MTDWLGISALYMLGIILLIVEVFVPAHMMIGLTGFVVLVYSIYLTSQRNESVAMSAVIGSLLILPAGLIWSLKIWHRTPLGKKISPARQPLTEEDRMPVRRLEALVGASGRSLTQLRPVGICEFNGRRIECKAEFGVIEAGVAVRGIRVIDRTLAVKPLASEEEATHS